MGWKDRLRKVFRREPKKQLGKPILKPEEAKGLTPEQRARVEVPTAKKPSDVIKSGNIQKTISRGGGGGGGGSSSNGGTPAPDTPKVQVVGGDKIFSTSKKTEQNKVKTLQPQPQTNNLKTTNTNLLYGYNRSNNVLDGISIRDGGGVDNKPDKLGSNFSSGFKSYTEKRPKVSSVIDRSSYGNFKHFEGLNLWEGLRGTVSNFFKGERGEEMVEPLTNIGKIKYEKVAYTKIPSGTVSPTSSATQQVTYGDLQKDIELRNLILVSSAIKPEREEYIKYNKELQSQIDTGKISYDLAVNLSEQRTKQANVNMQEIVKNLDLQPNISGLTERSKESALFIGGSLASSNPLTSSMAMAVSSKYDPLIVDVEAIKKGATIEGATTHKTSLRTGGFALATTLGGVKLLSKAGKEIVLADIEASVYKQSRLGLGTRTIIDKKIYDRISFGGKSGSVSVRTDLTSVSQMTGENTFVTGGTATQTIVGKSYWLEKPFFSATGKQFGTVPETYLGLNTLREGTTAQIGKYSLSSVSIKQRTVLDFSGTLQKAEMKIWTNQEYSKLNNYIGIGKKIKISNQDFIFSTGGKLDKAFLIEQGIRLDIKDPSNVLLKVMGQGDDSITSFSSGGGGLKYSKGFGSSILSKDLAKDLFSIPKLTQSSKLVSSSAGVSSVIAGGASIKQSAFYGKGLYERTEEVSIQSLNQPSASLKLKTDIRPVIHASLQKDLGLQTTTNKIYLSSLQQFSNFAPQSQTKISRLALIQLPKMRQVSLTKQKMDFAFPQPLTPAPNVKLPFDPYVPKKMFFPFLFPSGLPGGRRPKRRIKIKKIVRYTPSYSAIVFNIFGEKPKGVETGLRVRPIPKGWSFSEMFKLPKPMIKKRVKRRLK